jgi:hypothetical protein
MGSDEANARAERVPKRFVERERRAIYLERSDEEASRGERRRRDNKELLRKTD